MSFRGVSALGSDIYIAHFANGSAEWRIGLVKDGTIGRIALGPQYLGRQRSPGFNRAAPVVDTFAQVLQLPVALQECRILKQYGFRGPYTFVAAR